MEAHQLDPATGKDEMALAPRRRQRWRGNGTRCGGRPQPQGSSSWGKVGRNETCPCGSGKKYKHCHGRFA